MAYLGLLLFAGLEHSSRVSQGEIYSCCKRVRATEHAPRNPPHVLERRLGLAEIAARGGGVIVERPHVIPSHREREVITPSENTLRHGDNFAHE